MSVLNTNVSYFPNIKEVNNGVIINLLTLLQSNKHKDIILKLRGSAPAERKLIKQSLPCFTTAGVFNGRSNTGLIQSSGLAAVDLDSAEDYDALSILNQLKKIECIAYAGLSCSGSRIFCIIVFSYPDLYDRQYGRLIQSFIDYGLPMGDDCHKTISQPRFVSYNEPTTQFFNHDAKPYDLKLTKPTKPYYMGKRNILRPNFKIDRFDNFQWCVEQINKKISFSNGQRHNYILKLVSLCNFKGLLREDTLIGCLGFVEQDFEEREISNIINYIYKKNS
jgi:hypothetical protein